MRQASASAADATALKDSRSEPDCTRAQPPGTVQSQAVLYATDGSEGKRHMLSRSQVRCFSWIMNVNLACCKRKLCFKFKVKRSSIITFRLVGHYFKTTNRTSLLFIKWHKTASVIMLLSDEEFFLLENSCLQRW